MSDTENHPGSRQTKDVLGSDLPSPPPYTYEGEQPPPYSAYPSIAVCVSQPGTGYQPLHNLSPEISSDPALHLASSFDDRTVRRAFIRKVFSILMLQLLFTFSVVCVFTFSSVVKDVVQNSLWVYLSSFIIFAVVAISLSCCKSFSRTHPWNIVGLVVITLSLSYMVGTVASFHNTTAVVITMGVTLAITLAIIAFSAQTRFDFTIWTGVLVALAVDLMIFGICCSFYYSAILEIAFGCLGALLYSLFLMVDCQLLMGKMSYRLNPEEYINAALIIYLDIVLIFLYLLGRR